MHGTKFLLLFVAIFSGALAQFIVPTATGSNTDNFSDLSYNPYYFLELAKAKQIKGFRKNKKKYEDEHDRAFATGIPELLEYINVMGDGAIGYVDRRNRKSYTAGLKIKNEKNVLLSPIDVQPTTNLAIRAESLATKFLKLKKEYIIFFGDEGSVGAVDLAIAYMGYINKEKSSFFQKIVYLEDDFTSVLRDRVGVEKFPAGYFKDETED